VLVRPDRYVAGVATTVDALRETVGTLAAPMAVA
jgi:hypothetical protein